MPIYPDVDKKTEQQKRKAGKLVWLVEIYCQGRRYRRRHYGTRTEVIRQEAKAYQMILAEAGLF